MNPTPLPSAPGLKKRVVRVLLLVLACYLAACVLSALFQRRMIYHPRVFTAAFADQLGPRARLERWRNSAGEAIGWKCSSPEQPAQGQVLLVYGNASYAIGCAHYAEAIQSVAALDVFILEYPGYGDRTGSPSQGSLFRAAAEALPLLSTNRPVFLVGESLGSGVASYLAGTQPNRIAGVLLLSPFNRLTDVAQRHMPIFPVRLLLVDRFPSEDYLRDYHGPVGIMVDGEDEVVSEEFGLRLFQGYAGPKQLWEYPHGAHITIPEPAKFWRQVIDFWQNHPPLSSVASAPPPSAVK